MTWRELLGRLRAWRDRGALEANLSAEIEEHIELLALDLEREGMSANAARREARRRVGNVTSQREESRGYWGFPFVEDALRDLQYALRGLRRAPGFTFAVVITLGLGIGANAAMFAVIDRLMFRPLPLLQQPASVHRVYTQSTFEGRTNSNSVFPYTRYVDLTRDLQNFSEYAGVSEWRLGVGSESEAQVRKVAGVTASLFGFFDAPPVMGRYFTAAEDQPPLGEHVAVLSYEFWRNDFGAADVIGQPLKIGTTMFTIIGVAPRGFVGTAGGRAPELFVPITTIPANLNPSSKDDFFSRYNWDWTEVIVRRREGVSEEAANAELTAALIRSRASARAINPRVLPDSLVRPRAMVGAVRSAAGPGAGRESQVLLWVTGVAGIVLLIGCASVANLMLARVIRRRREITVRLALGVSPRRLMGQFVLESLLLSSLGCVAGLLFAQWGGIAIRRLLLPEGSPFNLAQDGRTLGVALFCATACTLLTALGPIWIARKTDLASTLRGGARDGMQGRSRAQTALLVLQVSLSVVLLIGSGLFVRSVQHIRDLPLGYDARPVIEVISDFRGQALTDVERGQARERLMEEARALPGVVAVSAVNSGLFRTNTTDLRVRGIDSIEALGRFNFQLASPDFFTVMQTRILRGRGFEPTDRLDGQLVAVVSEAMAARLWPGRDALGECIYVRFGGGEQPQASCTLIVGIAENTMQQNLTDDLRYTYYLPAAQITPNGLSTMLVRVRELDPTSQLEPIRRALTAAMPGDGFVVVRPLQDAVDDQSRSWRLGAALFLAFGGLSFVVAVVGLYGVISYDVAGRMHEIGVRLALGSPPSAVLRLIVMKGLQVATWGVVIGLTIATVAARWVQPLLYQQPAREPWLYALVGVGMLVVAAAASLMPARRAVRADPLAAVRAD